MENAAPMLKHGEVQICGVSCRLPGAADLNCFKGLLFEEKCAITSIPEDRWKAWPFHHGIPGQAGRTYTLAAGVIDDIWGFDPKAFNISPREAAAMDPQQRILLQLVWEALEDAGIPPARLAGKNVGVYVGVSSSDYSRRLALDAVHTSDPYMMTGNALSIVANRISHAFDFRGPSLAIDTACSSSLVALDNAFGDLNSGKIDTAIVAGINVLASPDSFGGFSAANMLSRSGLCQSFGNSADGYVRSEGGVALVLESPDSNEEISSPRASLLATMVNSDGWTPGISLPSEQAQFQLLNDVYKRSGIDPEDLLFVEAHGTGTFVGDPIEASAIGRALGKSRSNPLPIGSVKSNIGHLEPASGLAGVLKAVIALEEDKLPATLHANEPNQNIDFSGLNLGLAQKAVKLSPDGSKCLAGVNSFGFGGVNAHAIIRKGEHNVPKKQSVRPPNAPLLVSSFCQDSLKELLRQYRDELDERNEAETAELCAEAFYNRAFSNHRAAVLRTDSADRSQAISTFENGGNPETIISAQSGLQNEPPVFVYSGNGSQHIGMCRIALKTDQAYADHFATIDQQFEKQAGWRLRDVLSDPKFAEKLAFAEVAQPLLFADQIALTLALSDHGLKPAAVVGHSGGEISAACASGAMPLDQALRTIIERSNCQEELRGKGTMAAVQASAADVKTALEDFGNPNVTIAAENSPRSVTIVGPREPLSEFLLWIRRKLRWAGVKLDVDYPYHSPIQDQVEQKFRESLRNLTPQKHQIPFYSSVTGIQMNGTDLNEDHWWSLIRSPVKFNQVISRICDDGYRLFVECGAQPVLLSYLKDCVESREGEYALVRSFDRKDTDEVNPVEKTIARAIVHGAEFDAPMIFGQPGSFSRTLPSYPWQNTDFRLDVSSRISEYYGLSDGSSVLLGRRADQNSSSWTSEIDTTLVPDLAEHIIGGSSIMPGTGFLEAALCAASCALETEEVEIRNMDIFTPMGISNGAISQMRTAYSEETGSITISSRTLGENTRWQEHARCRAGKSNSGTLLRKAFAPDPEEHELDEPGSILYEYGKLVGLEYGKAFQRVARFRQTGPTVVEVFLNSAENYPQDNHYTCIAPPAADAVLHGLLALLFRSDEFPDGLGFVPVFLKKLKLLKAGTPIFSGRVEVSHVGRRSILAECVYFDEFGNPIAILEGIRLRATQLVDNVSLEEHVFQTNLERVWQLPGSNINNYLSADRIAELINETAASADFSSDDDSQYIIDAISNSIAHETISKYCDGKNFFVSPDLGADSESGKAVAILLDMLQASDLADETGNGVKIAKETGLPPASDLIAGLLADNPERVAECRVLARMSSALPEIVSGIITPDPDRIFGRNNISGFKSFAITSKQPGIFLQTVLRRIVETVGNDLVTRVLVLSDDSDFTSRIENSGLAQRCHLEVWTSEKLESEVSSQDKASTSEFARFDLVVSHLGTRQENVGEEFTDSVSRIMAEGSTLLVMHKSQGSFERLMSCGDKEQLESQTQSSGFGSGFSMDKDNWSRLTTAAGFENQIIKSLSESLDGISLFLAQKPQSSDETFTTPVNGTSEYSFADYAEKLSDELASVFAQDEKPIPVWHDESEVFSFMVGESSQWLLFPSVEDESKAREILEKRILYVARFLDGQSDQVSEICLVTPNAANHGSAKSILPGQTALWNLARTVRNEYPHLRIRTIDSGCPSNASMAAHLTCQIVASDLDDDELVITENTVSAVRVVKGLRRECGTVFKPQKLKNSKAELSVPLNGRISDLEWSVSNRVAPGPKEVEVRVDATGLNYRDVMWSMGLLPEEALEKGFSGAAIGMECAGTVTRIGKDVSDFSPGDKVMAVGSSCFSTYMTANSAYCFKLPENVDTKAAAVMPVTFFTAYYSLVNAARIRAGETVLVHGAAGGVGLAAIQIARLKGARVLATAGSPDKRDLLRTIGVEEVFDSRSLAFEEAVIEATDGAGVDVVLNSLAGEAMERSLGVLKSFGRFVELGKQDFYANTKIGLRALRENIEYLSVDVDQLLAERPEMTRDVFGQIVELFENGEIEPIPYYHFTSGEVIDAFKFMQRSAHVGKITISPPEAEEAKINVGKVRFVADPAGTYVIAGGAGGLGSETARWLAHHGARSVFLLGRRAKPTPSVAELIEKFTSFGCTLEYVSCDISDGDEVEATFELIRKKLPIKGVFHAAMHLEDCAIKDLDADKIRDTLSSKVTGTENLSEASRKDKLDFFVVFSSIAALIGNQRQAAYVAANAYQEALIRRRVEKGLPGLSVGWGAISDVGYLTENTAAAELLAKVTGDVKFTSRKALDCLGRILAKPTVMNENPVISVSDMNWSNLVSQLTTLRSPTFKVLAKSASEPTGISGKRDLRLQLEQMTAEKAERELERFIQAEISKILRIPVEEVKTEKPMTDLGMDSLMGVEFGMAAQQSLGDDIPLVSISDGASIKQVSARIVRHIKMASERTESSDNVLDNLVSQHSGGQGHAEIAADLGKRLRDKSGDDRIGKS